MRRITGHEWFKGVGIVGSADGYCHTSTYQNFAKLFTHQSIKNIFAYEIR